MIAVTDVHYDDATGTAVAAAVLVDRWTAEQPVANHVVTVHGIEAYVPGEFYRRELPCLLAVLGVIDEPLRAVVVDGHVWLGQRPGLGHHLWQALGRRVAVVGIAKNRFHAGGHVDVRRGSSERPLCVTAVGMDAQAAAREVASMTGEHRIPDLCRAVDALARGRA